MKTNLCSFYLFVLYIFYTVTVHSMVIGNDSMLISRLSRYIHENPIERVYVHQDRTHYYAGEMIWLKVYQNLSPSAEVASQVVYVDLANGNGDIIAQGKYPLIDGQASGNIQIPYSVDAGHYQLRAYTRWMLNFAPNGLFHRELTIYGGQREDKNESEYSSSGYQLRFFPEGGNLVEGLASRIAFEISNGSDEALPAEGVILNRQGDSIQQFSTNHLRKGSFYFLPEKGEHYTIRLKGFDKLFKLPEISKEGFVVTIKYLDDALRILIAQNIRMVDAEHVYKLIAHQNGEVFAQLPVNCTQLYNLFDLPLEKLPAGVFTLTLIDENYRVYSERLVFARFPETLNLKMSSEISLQEGHRKIEVDIDVRNKEGVPQQGYFSLAIARPLLEQSAYRSNMKTYFFLGSELNGHLNQLSSYWNPDDPECLSDIELLLLTRGWRRYSLEELQQPAAPPYYTMELGLTLSGRVKNISKRKAKTVTVQAVVQIDSMRQFSSCALDSAKRFEFFGLSFEGSKQVLLSAKDSGDKKYSIILDDLNPIPPVDYRSYFGIRDSAYYVEWKMNEPYIPKKIDKQIFNLGEIKVTGRKRDAIEKRRMYDEGFVKTSVKVKELNSFGDVRQLLRTVPGVTMVYPKNIYLQNQPLVHINGTPKNTYASFILDGFAVRDPEMIYGMDAANIERVEVLRSTMTMFGGFSDGGGSIAIYTRNPGEGIPTEDHNLICNWIGFSQVKEFYVPVSQDINFFEKSEQRNTLYWNPDIRTDTAGKAHVSFYLNDSEEGDYTIHCEGYSEKGIVGAEASIMKLPIHP